MILSKRRRRSCAGPELMSIAGGRFGEPPYVFFWKGLVNQQQLVAKQQITSD